MEGKLLRYLEVMTKRYVESYYFKTMEHLETVVHDDDSVSIVFRSQQTTLTVTLRDDDIRENIEEVIT